MNPAMDLGHFLDSVNATALFLGSISVIIGVLIKVWRAQKAAVIKAHAAAQVMDRVAAEFQNNHGSSMKDAIDRLEAGQADQVRQMENHRQQVAELHTAQAELIRRVDDTYRLFAQVIAPEEN